MTTPETVGAILTQGAHARVIERAQKAEAASLRVAQQIDMEAAKLQRRERIFAEFCTKGAFIANALLNQGIEPNLTFMEWVLQPHTKWQRLTFSYAKTKLLPVDGVAGWLVNVMPDADEVVSPSRVLGFEGGGLTLLTTGEIAFWEGMYRTIDGPTATLKRTLKPIDLCRYDNFGRDPVDPNIPLQQDAAFTAAMQAITDYGIRALENAQAEIGLQ